MGDRAPGDEGVLPSRRRAGLLAVVALALGLPVSATAEPARVASLSVTHATLGTVTLAYARDGHGRV